MTTDEGWINKPDGRRLFSRQAIPGSPVKGDAVLFLHGLGSCGAEFGPVPLLLAEKGYPAFAVDLSGHGQSDGARGVLSQRIVRDDVTAAVAHVRTVYPLCRCHVVGHSLGSHAAFWAAANLETVTSCIAIAPQLRSGGRLKPFARFLLYLTGHLYSTLPFLPDFFVRNRATYAQICSTPEAVAQAKKAAFMAPLLNVKISAYAKDVDNLSLVKTLTKPVLLIAGGKDPQVSVADIRRLAENVPSGKGRVVVLEAAGHNPFFDSSTSRKPRPSGWGKDETLRVNPERSPAIDGGDSRRVDRDQEALINVIADFIAGK